LPRVEEDQSHFSTRNGQPVKGGEKPGTPPTGINWLRQHYGVAVVLMPIF